MTLELKVFPDPRGRIISPGSAGVLLESQGVPLDGSSPDPGGESLVRESRGVPRIQGKFL